MLCATEFVSLLAWLLYRIVLSTGKGDSAVGTHDRVSEISLAVSFRTQRAVSLLSWLLFSDTERD